MIITRYLVQEILKSQLAIFFVLLFIFLCQKLIKILDSAINCELPENITIYLLVLGIPEITQLILPLSLLLGILVTLTRFYSDNIITVMFACGLSKAALVKMAMLLALITGFIASINVIWIGPLSSRYQYTILKETKANLDITQLACGKFQKINDSNLILFIEKINKNHFSNVFLAKLDLQKNDKSSIVVATSGYFTQKKEGLRIITLNHGITFEGEEKLKNFRITSFQNYQIIVDNQIIKPNPSNAEQMNICALLNGNNPEYAELHWRMTLIFTVFIMALMAVPLSSFTPRQGRILSMIPAILLYLIFFLLQSTIKSNGTKGSLNSALWAWLINGFYFLLAFLLNIWDTIAIRRIRSHLAMYNKENK